MGDPTIWMGHLTEPSGPTTRNLILRRSLKMGACHLERTAGLAVRMRRSLKMPDGRPAWAGRGHPFPPRGEGGWPK